MSDADVAPRIGIVADCLFGPRGANRGLRWWSRLPAPLRPTSRDIWLAVTPIWAVLAFSRVLFYALERIRFPQIVPPVVADAIQAVLLWPLVMVGCYLILGAWVRFGLRWAIAAAVGTTAAFGALARPAYAIGSLLNQDSEAARAWLQGFHAADSGSLVPWLSNAVEYGALYLSCVAAAAGFLTYRSLMNERLLLTRVEATAAQERLRTLRAQLNPHFLFNALNSIVCLNETHAHGAQNLIGQLSDLLRRTLRASEREEHDLTEELAYVEAYLQIERIRRPSRIDWTVSIDAGCAGAAVPSLILLPLVENAVTHGLRGANRVAIGIRVERARHRLVIHVSNTCRQRGSDAQAGCSGLGLRNVRERLEVLFGAHAMLLAHRPSPDQFEAQIRLPLRASCGAIAPLENHA